VCSKQKKNYKKIGKKYVVQNHKKNLKIKKYTKKKEKNLISINKCTLYVFPPSLHMRMEKKRGAEWNGNTGRYGTRMEIEVRMGTEMMKKMELFMRMDMVRERRGKDKGGKRDGDGDVAESNNNIHRDSDCCNCHSRSSGGRRRPHHTYTEKHMLMNGCNRAVSFFQICIE
jgi:hypothetical protein